MQRKATPKRHATTNPARKPLQKQQKTKGKTAVSERAVSQAERQTALTFQFTKDAPVRSRMFNGRTFVFPATATDDDVYGIVSDLRQAERRTGTRYTGKNPLEFLLAYRSYVAERTFQTDGVTFAEHVRQHQGLIDKRQVYDRIAVGPARVEQRPEAEALHPDALKILRFLSDENHQKHSWKIGQLVSEAPLAECSESTIKKRVQQLETRGFVHRPEGERSGVTPTPAGLTFAQGAS